MRLVVFGACRQVISKVVLTELIIRLYDRLPLWTRECKVAMLTLT